MNKPLHLFDAIGIEIEYMIVDRDTLNIRPIADQLFRTVLGHDGADVEGPEITWSNELVNHVVELKTTRPTTDLAASMDAFEREVKRVNQYLAPMNAMLLGTGMHPWMNPLQETVLFPGENNEIYRTFDRIFDCRGHGWSNVQSTHINLPFCGDEEFRRLHTAIRLVLPLIPVLAAWSPMVEGRYEGIADNRLRFVRQNCKRVPEVAGDYIPPVIGSEEEYRDKIFKPMMKAIAPLDPDGILQPEWLNARAAIPRFERGSIEIRVMDAQACPMFDLILAGAFVAVVRGFVEERLCSYASQATVTQDQLSALLDQAIIHGDDGEFSIDEWQATFDKRSGASRSTNRTQASELLFSQFNYSALTGISPDLLFCEATPSSRSKVADIRERLDLSGEDPMYHMRQYWAEQALLLDDDVKVVFHSE